MSTDLARRCKQFKAVAKALKEKNITSYLIHPARMKVQHNGRSHLFDTPGEVFTFLKELNCVWFTKVYPWNLMQFIVFFLVCAVLGLNVYVECESVYPAIRSLLLISTFSTNSYFSCGELYYIYRRVYFILTISTGLSKLVGLGPFSPHLCFSSSPEKRLNCFSYCWQ